MKESEAMKWVRQVKDDISTDVSGMNSKQRVEYLKEQSKKAKEVMGQRSMREV
jgi:hypothetical protein